MFKKTLEKGETALEEGEQALEVEMVAMYIHHWLRRHEILDEDHDLPYAATPAQYRAELIEAIEGKFYKNAEKEEKDGNQT
jgi:hypothetical protein